MTTLFIVGLSLEMNEQDLIRFFTPYGEVSWARIVVNKYTGRNLGYAFIGVLNPEVANWAIAGLNRKKLFGNRITVKIAKDSSWTKPKTSGKRRRLAIESATKITKF